MRTRTQVDILPGVSADHSMDGSEASEPNGLEESPLAEMEQPTSEMDSIKEEKFFKVIYGEVVSQEDGCEVEGYPAVSRGVSKTIATQSLATLIFRAVSGHAYNILEIVPQKVQCNWLFLINLKKLSKPTDVYYDGLGAWDQNCGKITNTFRFVDGEAKVNMDAKEEKGEDVVTFIRRTDRNVSCKSFNRVIVTCPKFALAAVQYFFKGRDETPFDISTTVTKSVRLSTMTDSSMRSGRGKRKAGSMLGEDAESSGEIMYLSGTSNEQPLPVRVTALRNVNSSSLENGDASATLLTFLRTFTNNIREERKEERQLRREELELRKKERTEEHAWRKEEAETRKKERLEEAELKKQEMALERSRLALEQQRWEIDRREKEMFLELLRKKLVENQPL